ncbi:hypothetical protein Tco_1255555 [Tanacetum coccineum]
MLYSGVEDDSSVQHQEFHDDSLDLQHNDQLMNEADSVLGSMHVDDIVSLSGFEAEESDVDDIHSVHKEELSNSEKGTADRVDMDKNTNASADKPSLSNPFGHLQKEISSPTSRVERLESSFLAQQVVDKLENSMPRLIIKDSVNQALPKFDTRVKKTLEDQLGVRKEVQVVQEVLKYCVSILDKTDVNMRELVDLIKELVILIDTEAPLFKAAPMREKKSTHDRVPAPAHEEPQLRKNLLSCSSEFSSIPPLIIADKGKGIATKKEPSKQVIPLMEQGGSDPKILNLQQFNISSKKITLDDAKAQLTKMKRLADPKAEQEKTEQRLKALSNKELEAQVAQLAAYEPKRPKMLEEYNYYITFRADPLPFTKISYKIDNSSKQASMKITRNNQPYNLTVYDMFVLKILGFSEWLEVHALASKAGRLGISPPPELSAFGLYVSKKKRKRSYEILKEVFVKEDIVVDGMHRNLVPPPGVEDSRGLVISEPKSGIFFYNGNFNLVFQREEEFHLATIAQMIRTQSAIQRGTLE